MPIEAVTFDYWNTLVSEDPTQLGHRVAAWERILEVAGHQVSVDEVRAAFKHGWTSYVGAWHANSSVYGAPDAVTAMLAVLGVQVSAVVQNELTAVFLDPPTNRYPSLNPNVVVCLGALHAAGIKIGIICDVGLTPSTVLRRYLDQQGALEYFDHWSFSDEVGTYKPDPAIFGYALAGLGGITPSRAAHVGDLRRTDIAGAIACSMIAVRYTGVNDDPAPEGEPVIEGHHVVADHADLPAVLGIS